MTIEIEQRNRVDVMASYSIFRQVRVDGVGGLTQPTKQVYLIVIVVLNQFLFAIYVITITCIEMFGGNTAFQHAELNEIVGEGFLRCHKRLFCVQRECVGGIGFTLLTS